MRYFIVHLKTGNTFDFEKKCCYVRLLDQCFVQCQTKDLGEVLMLIPYENILYIESEEK